MTKLFIASDHAGYSLKEFIKKKIVNKKIKINDLGPSMSKTVDYPDYAHKLSKKININKKSKGILICGSGIGMTITANKYKNVRAALCYNLKSTRLSRQHNNANVMALGARLINKNLALKCVNAFLSTEFLGGRHQRRIKKI